MFVGRPQFAVMILVAIPLAFAGGSGAAAQTRQSEVSTHAEVAETKGAIVDPARLIARASDFIGAAQLTLEESDGRVLTEAPRTALSNEIRRQSLYVAIATQDAADGDFRSASSLHQLQQSLDAPVVAVADAVSEWVSVSGLRDVNSGPVALETFG